MYQEAEDEREGRLTNNFKRFDTVRDQHNRKVSVRTKVRLHIFNQAGGDATKGQREAHGDAWPMDSHDKRLSHTKMKFEVMKTRLTKNVKPGNLTLDKDGKIDIDGLPEYENYPICGSNFGYFCPCCRNIERSEIQESLGLGVVIYFKQIKNHICILLLCTLLSLPSFILFSSGTAMQ